jgi:cysteine desulfuration protein SufE
MTAPLEAPTTRAFAAILQTILDGQPVDDVLAFDADYPSKIGLTSLVSPLRIRGMLGMLNRIKKQVQQKADKNG